ncbi:hypothetical protein ASG88_03415 [Nocardioides sp. Soil777]|uniref:hypothetical protein n=1 Tax=Nocardioides sp. Soil777 TaxID=1736409 RepID=UPI000702AECC|nr:hypothetical protein [Nocardioides sp. Soil777]KRF07863.1 hypothetical protein ASG88_03415 [Nocardioides sp. Soil777]
MKRTFACRIGLHTWRVRRDPGVAPYVACRRCHKAKMVDTRPENIAGAGADMLSPYKKKDF